MRPALPPPASIVRPRRSTWAIGLILLLTVGAALPARPAAAAPRQVVVAAGPPAHGATARPGAGRADVRYFAETGHTLAGGFATTGRPRTAPPCSACP